MLRPTTQLFIPLLFAYILIATVSAEENKTVEYEILQFDFVDVEKPIVVASWLVLAGLAKILFHIIHPVAKYFPESSLLIVVGLILGSILHWGIESIKAQYYQLDSKVFFYFLLPPIIFDAGYFMPNRALFQNIDSVVLFAVVGTVFNTFAIGASLWWMSTYQLFTVPFDLFEVFTFASLISAVDPVAVIAVFEEIHVNEFLFVNVFGEALFNDGVSVVLYKMFKSFYDIGSSNVDGGDYAKGGVSFFAIACGGTVVGILFAFIVSFITKHTDHMRVLTPLFIFVVPYLGYLFAESVGVSSILAIATCGMVMKQYVKGNITTAAANAVKYFTKMLAQSSEMLIFMFLGVSAVATPHHFDWVFIGCTIAFCLLFRTIGVVIQCFFLNKFRGKEFSVVDQFILSYGGLRGAIAYGLAVSLPDTMQSKTMFVTTTIVVIYFTVFLQGMTIRPLVNFLKIETVTERKPTMTESVYLKYLDYTMSGVEEIFGVRGHNYLRDAYERVNAKILRPILMRNEKKKDFDASKIVRAYEKITLQEVMELNQKTVERKPRQTQSYKDLQDLRRAEVVSGDARKKRALSTVSQAQASAAVQEVTNVEALYQLFSDLLDRKMTELKADPNSKAHNVDEGTQEDLPDDYMQMTINHQQTYHAHNGIRPMMQNIPHSLAGRQSSVPFSSTNTTRKNFIRRRSTGTMEKNIT